MLYEQPHNDGYQQISLTDLLHVRFQRERGGKPLSAFRFRPEDLDPLERATEIAQGEGDAHARLVGSIALKNGLRMEIGAGAGHVMLRIVAGEKICVRAGLEGAAIPALVTAISEFRKSVSEKENNR